MTMQSIGYFIFTSLGKKGSIFGCCFVREGSVNEFVNKREKIPLRTDEEKF